MEEGRRRCGRCGSIDLMSRLNASTRCWHCGALVADEAPAPRPLPEPTSPPPAFVPLVSPAQRAVALVPERTFMVAATLPKQEAERLIQRSLQRFFRPADLDKSEFSPLVLLYVPVWRVDAAIESFYIGLQHSTGSNGMLRWVVPTGGFRHRDGVALFMGRRFFPIDPTPNITIALDELQPTQTPTDGELITPDVQQSEAEAEAAERLRHKVHPQGALYARFEGRIRSTALCYYPLWVQRYRYQGSAAWHSQLEECHIAVSGRKARIVSAKHPSALWSLFDRAKRVFASPEAP